MRSLSLSIVVAAVALGAPTTASASCIQMTSAERERTADVIFIGRVLEEPNATGVQRFRVERYLKGNGPKTAAVQTGTVRGPSGSMATTSVSIDARLGDRWRIHALKRSTSLETNQCLGSRRLQARSAEHAPSRSPTSSAAPTDASGFGSVRMVFALALAALIGLATLILGRRRRFV